MTTPTRQQILELMNQILARQGKGPIASEAQALSDLRFRSLDFSELALRVEGLAQRELVFDASSLRAVTSVADVLDFMVSASAGSP